MTFLFCVLISFIFTVDSYTIHIYDPIGQWLCSLDYVPNVPFYGCLARTATFNANASCCGVAMLWPNLTDTSLNPGLYSFVESDLSGHNVINIVAPSNPINQIFSYQVSYSGIEPQSFVVTSLNYTLRGQYAQLCSRTYGCCLTTGSPCYAQNNYQLAFDQTTMTMQISLSVQNYFVNATVFQVSKDSGGVIVVVSNRGGLASISSGSLSRRIVVKNS
jgi:uncharacterized protein (DUF779 family)